MSDDPTPEDISELVERIDENTPWDVEDWQHTTGRYDAATVTVEVEWDPISALDPENAKDLHHTTKEVIEAGESGEGTPIEDVIESVKKTCDVSEDIAHQTIERLKQKGEVYEPRTDHLRVT